MENTDLWIPSSVINTKRSILGSLMFLVYINHPPEDLILVTNLSIIYHFINLSINLSLPRFSSITICKSYIRAHFHQTRSELKPVWDYTSGWYLIFVEHNFIISVYMSLGEVKLTSVQILLRSIWPKWNFKLSWVFHGNSKCPQWSKVAQNHFSL